MHRHLAVILMVSGLVMAPGAMAAAQTSSGTVGIRLMDAPSDRADDPRARSYIVDHLNLGATIERRIEVSNTTDEPQPVQLYAAGADVTDTGWTVLDGREANELSEMVTVEPGQVVVPAGGTREATVTVEVPGDATQREHYGVIWAELAASEGQVSVVNRVGIRMYVSIGSGAEPASDFTVDNLIATRAADGAPEVLATVTNTGARALDIGGELRLSDGPAGLSAGPFPAAGLTTLGPGRTGTMTVSLDGELPSGPWLAHLVARSGTVEHSVQARITFPDAPGEVTGAVDAVPFHQDRAAMVPIATGLVGVGSAAALSVWFVFGRRRPEAARQ